MNTYCPNLSNAQVRQEFNDLVQAVGEDQAYLVWHRNNGYALTSAPNGAESLLFQKLLEKYHGDYNLAIQKKAAMYLSKYTDQNGKWYEGKSKIPFDENGEPLLQEELPDYQKNEIRRKNRLEVIKPYIKNIVPIKNILPVIDSGLIDAENTPINKLYIVISDFFNKLPVPENLNVYYLDNKIRKDLPYYKNVAGFMTSDSTGFYIIDDRENYFYNNTYLTNNGIPVFIHELTHALLSKSIKENKEFGNNVQNLYNYTVQYLKNTNIYDRYKDMYGFTNIDEFVSEAVSNVSFMRVLDNIPSPNEEKSSIFDEFLKVVKKLLKEIRKGFSGEKHSVLDDVFKLFNLDNFDIYEHDQEERHILEYAKRDENGKLLAPNGKPSNLTEKQYAQESSEFINKIDNIEKRITDDMEWSDIVDMLVNEGILEKGYWGILGREIVMANINGVKIPFYRSNNGTSNKKAGKWYQFFGFGNADSSSKSNDWFIKGSNKNNNEIENGYGSIDIQRLTKLFNDYLNWTGKHDDTMNMHSVYDFTEKGIDGGTHFHLGEERLDDINEILYGDKNISLTGNEARKALDERIQKIKDNSVGTSSRTDNNTYYLQTSGNTQDVLTNLFSNDNIDIFLKGNNTQQLLQQLINDSYIADPFKPFAEVLARHNIPIIISEENSNNLMSTFVDNNGGVVISINPKVLRHVSTGFAAEKLMHEVVHALTTEGLSEDSHIFDRKLNRITEKLFNLYNKQFPSERFSRNDYTNGYNGLQDKYEFVAEFLTNQSFRQLLFDKAKQLDKNNNKQSVLQSLKSFIQNIINFLVNKKSNTENLEKYQLQLFDYINNKNAIVNGNIKSEQQLKDLIKSVDTYKFIAENVLEGDELLQKLHPVVKRYNFTLGASIINRFIQNNSEYQKQLKEQKNKKVRRAALLRQDVKESFNVVIPEIIQALETRQKAVKIAKISNDQKYKILSGLASQISALKSETMSDLNRVAYVLNAVLPDIIDESEKIHDAAVTLYKDGIYVLSDTDYMYEMHDYFGVYQNVLNSLLDVFTHPGINEAMKEYESDNLSLLSSLNDFIEKVETCKSLCDTSINILKNI